MTGKSSSIWIAVLIATLVALVAAGGYGYAQQLLHGDVVTGMRTVGAGGVVWGLFIVMDGFFLGAGIVVMLSACLARLFGGRRLEPVARLAMPVAITCFLGAGLCVLADQGRPIAALLALSLYARPQSPMFVTFTTVTAACLFGSLVHCVLARRPDLAEYAKRKSFWRPLQRLLAAGWAGTSAELHRRAKSGFWMSFLMVPALLAPLLALAVLFTVRSARPLPSAMLEIASFLLASGAAGVGLLLVAAGLVEKLAGHEAGLGRVARARLAAVLLLVVSLALAGSIASVIIGLAAREPAVVDVARAMLSDGGAVLFWGELACFVGAALALLWEARHGFQRTRRIVAAATLAQAGAFAHHYLQLTVWQTHGLSLPYAPGTYGPTFVELLVGSGIVAFSLLALLPAVRLIPFAPVARDVATSAPVPRPDWSRRSVTGLWAMGGSALAAVGLVLSNRVGTEPLQGPVVAGSPLLFALGLCLLVTTGAVYELWPERSPFVPLATLPPTEQGGPDEQ
jgi:Ni/Fe-hydrogenase subunit HybB-like protein